MILCNDEGMHVARFNNPQNPFWVKSKKDMGVNIINVDVESGGMFLVSFYVWVYVDSKPYYFVRAQHFW